MPRNEALKIFRDGREECLNTAAGKHEYRARTVDMIDRQKGLCPICGLWLIEDVAQFDHEAGRGHGGGHRDDRLLHADGTWRNAALHPECNTRKGSKRYHWVGGKYVPNIREVQEAA